MYIGRISLNSHLSKRYVKMLNDVVFYKCASNDVILSSPFLNRVIFKSMAYRDIYTIQVCICIY